MKSLKMLALMLVAAAVLIAGCTTPESPAVTPTTTIAPTDTITVAPTETDTVTPTETDTVTPTETDTVAPTDTTTETPTDTTTPTPVTNETQTPAMKTIIETAEDAGSFTTLLAAVDAAGLNETLSGEGPFTVFAPTDAAFADLPEGTVETLLEDPEGELKEILLYHVANGKYMAADVLTMNSIETLQGSPLTVNTTGGLQVDGAMIITTDIEGSNGVIHIIDAVMIPPEA